MKPKSQYMGKKEEMYNARILFKKRETDKYIRRMKGRGYLRTRRVIKSETCYTYTVALLLYKTISFYAE